MKRFNHLQVLFMAWICLQGMLILLCKGSNREKGPSNSYFIQADFASEKFCCQRLSFQYQNMSDPMKVCWQMCIDSPSACSGDA